jgi:hypothetical protein
LEKYLNWLTEEKYFYSRFICLSNKFCDAFIDFKPVEKEEHSKYGTHNLSAGQIVTALNKALDCKDLFFTEYSEIVAYGIWHFLERYGYFLQIYLDLMKLGILPIKQKRISVLDIACGPAAASYALSDIYSSINKFKEQRSIFPKYKFDFKSDYIENSSAFRHWLHYFTEVANCGIDNKWVVPYHHGTYSDFFNFQVKGNMKFNIITIGNFYITKELYSSYLQSICTCIGALKTGGLLICIGKNSDFQELMVKVENTVIQRGLKKINLYTKDSLKKLKHIFNIGMLLREYYAKILVEIEACNLSNKLNTKVFEALERRVKSEPLINTKVYFFRKGLLPPGVVMS